MDQTARIRDAVRHAFESRSGDVVLELLGFQSPITCVPVTRGECWYCGARGSLLCYLVRLSDLDRADVAHVARELHNRNATQFQLFVFVDHAFSSLIVGSYGLAKQLLVLSLDRDDLRASDIEAFEELIPKDGEGGTALAARYGKALDRSRITKRFFYDFAAQRDRVSLAWIGIPAQRKRDRDQLALLLLSRLMFLYFLQHRGHLRGDRSYLLRHFRNERRRSFYSDSLRPLFFHVLNRRPEARPSTAAAFGDLPYLNGGLFERHPLERKYPRADIRDDCIAGVFEDLLERYRFTAREAADAESSGVHDVGVDPEMLGRVFEGLMGGEQRASTGTFYTPAPTVDRLVAGALTALISPRLGEASTTALVRERNVDALDYEQRAFVSSLLRKLKVIDPACGSGAFLLSALSRIAQSRAAAENVDELIVRRDVVADALYGVDIQSDAALLCALRLWLGLIPGAASAKVQPLPNLDRNIRQGDVLVDPLDLKAAVNDSEVRRRVSMLQPLLHSYVHSEPEQRAALQRQLSGLERGVSRAWINAQQRRLRNQEVELSVLAGQRDLFGARTTEAQRAQHQLSDLLTRIAEIRRVARRARTQREVPFFSLGVHFGEAALCGFDLALCNPPWVRSHNWTSSMPGSARRRFTVCANGERQPDLAWLFLERALDLLKEGGVLGIVLPAKLLRSQSAAGARRLLLERTEIVSIEDHSLDQRSIFEADAFAALVIARKCKPSPVASTSVTMVRRNGAPQVFSIRQRDLPLLQADHAEPWSIAPPDVRRVMTKMLEFPPLAQHSSLAIQRGIVTGDNGVLVLSKVERKLGNLALIESDGMRRGDAKLYSAVVEESAVSPLLRGSDLRAWVNRPSRYVLCRTPRSVRSLPRAAKYAQGHNVAIPLFNCDKAKVVWHDLARNVNASVTTGDVVPLNTVYFIPAIDETAHLLCAYLNSTPFRVFARVIAERAKDAHFRFFAWTMARVPLPANWRSFECARLIDLSRTCHNTGAITDEGQRILDDIVARAFRLTSSEAQALAQFDAWLRS
ncbi:MAG TPA: hypothetical protein VM100_07835 [Longimicrobiales bacterium]|nr:hypothetical protein [Longimicrobiales bacterium]